MIHVHIHVCMCIQLKQPTLVLLVFFRLKMFRYAVIYKPCMFSMWIYIAYRSQALSVAHTQCCPIPYLKMWIESN